MSFEQIEKTLLQLPREERSRFADSFYQHENEILDPQDEDDIPSSVKPEVLRHHDQALASLELKES